MSIADDWGAYCNCGHCQYCTRRSRERSENNRQKLRDALHYYEEAQALSIVAEFYTALRAKNAKAAEEKRNSEIAEAQQQLSAAEYRLRALGVKR